MTHPTDFRSLVADDAYAASFQSLGQYRAALLKALSAESLPRPTIFRDELERLVNAIGPASDAADLMLLAHRAHDALDRARAALSAAPQQPSDEELIKTYCDARRVFYFEAAQGESDQEDRKEATIAGLRAVLTRYGGQAAPQQGAPAVDWEWVEEVYHEQRGGDYHMRESQFASAVEIILTRYGGQAMPVPVAESVHYDFAVYDALKDEPQAGGEAPTLEEAQREGQHYFAMYSEDGPMRLELRRVEVLPLPEAQP